MTSPRPLVSVVVPTFNDAECLDRAVQSVLRQTYTTWELVVVDDASHDHTAATVANYRDPRIRYVLQSINGGVAVTQNSGIDHAVGDFVVFLHSDDELLATKLAQQVSLFERSSSNIGAVQSGIEIVWSDYTEIRPATFDVESWRDLLHAHTRVHISGLMVRRDLAKELRFDPALRGAEDRDFCIRLVRSTRLAFDDEPLSRVNKTRVGLSSQNMAPMYLHLVHKYQAEIESDRRLHAEWQFKIARAHARAGDAQSARVALRRSVRLRTTKVSRWFLLVGSLGGDATTMAAFRAYVRFASARQRAHR